MTLDNDTALHGNSVTHQFDLDRLNEILKDALAVPVREGLALLVQAQVARAAGSEGFSVPDLASAQERAA